MDLNEIKSIIKIDGGKFIIVENDKPSLVVISFEDYKKHLQKREASEDGQSQSLFGEKIDEKEEDLSSNVSTEAQSREGETLASEEKGDKKSDDELTIDDLPL